MIDPSTMYPLDYIALGADLNNSRKPTLCEYYTSVKIGSTLLRLRKLIIKDVVFVEYVENDEIKVRRI